MGKMPLVKRSQNNDGATQSTTLAGSPLMPVAHQIVPLQRFATIEAMVKALKPVAPVHCLHADALRAAARTFLTGFAGKTFYAVKCNPQPRVVAELFAAGVRHYDVASLAEVALVHDLCPGAHMAFMHPIKSREAIAAAYFQYGVRDFAIDTFEELHKIMEATQAAVDLTIHIRLDLPKGKALMDLSGKFGASPEAAVQLLRDVDKVAARTGLHFHVGSQMLDPEAYADAIKLAGDIVRQSKVTLDVLDVGGGFPANYPGMAAPDMGVFFSTIKQAYDAQKFGKGCELWCEPGRAMVVSGESVIVRVELRKGDALYLNDGVYGSLFDAGTFAWRYPVNLIRSHASARKSGKQQVGYRFFGPTCDSHDVMPGPFMLPDDVCEGDWIVIGQHGAYGSAIQTRFNGFYSDFMVEIDPATQPEKIETRKAAGRKSAAIMREVTAQ